MSGNDHNRDTTIARQDMLLKHIWSSQDIVKQYRLRIPTIIGFLNLVIVSFVYESKGIPSTFTDKIIFTIANLLVMGLGIGGLYSVQLTYKLFGARLEHLYKAMSMDNEKHFARSTVYWAWPVWFVCYSSVIVFGIFSAIAILFAPIAGAAT